MSDSPAIDLDHVSALARIELSDAEKQKFAGDFRTILGFFEKLNAVDVSALEPCAHAFPVYNVLRDDFPEKRFPSKPSCATLPPPAKTKSSFPASSTIITDS